jgi:beta-catenin-like protein 1
MPATPDMQFFDKYKEASEALEQTEEPATKKRNIEEDEDMINTDYYQEETEYEEDDEGRFFGGGLTSEQSSILDLVDEYDVDEVIVYLDCITITKY